MDFFGDISGVLFVKNIFYGQQQVVGFLQAVNVVRDGDEADIVDGKIAFQVFPGVNVIPSEPGQVFDDNTVYVPGFDIFCHVLKGWTGEIGSCEAVIYVNAVFDTIRFNGRYTREPNDLPAGIQLFQVK
jgi:hypothetical protein